MPPQAWLALAIFVAAYIAIASDKVDRAMVAIAGAALMLGTGLVDQVSAFERIDLNVIFLLAGMMIIINIVKRSGLFEWIAISTAKATGGKPILLLITLSLITAATSAFLDNVTTMMLIAPITLLIADSLRIDPVPLLLSEVMASNIGGTATLIGDPPHILIGSAANLSFLDFLQNMTPIVVLVLVIFLVMSNLTFGRGLRKSPPNLTALASLRPRKAIKDKYLLWKSVGVLAVVFTLFIFHEKLGMYPATVAIIGAALLLILAQLPPVKHKIDSMDLLLAEVDWPTLFFFIGMFVMVAGLEKSGVIATLVNLIMNLARDQLLLTAILIIWGSAAITMFTSAVPFVIAVIPVIQALSAQGVEPIAPLWWSLALGAALGSNGTLIGSAANMVVIGVSRRSGHPISFGEFSRKGLPITIISLVLSSIYVWLRYFVLA